MIHFHKTVCYHALTQCITTLSLKWRRGRHLLKHLNPMLLVSHNTPRKPNNHSAAAFPKKAGLLLVYYRNLWHLCSGITVTLKKHCANSCHRSLPMKFCSLYVSGAQQFSIHLSPEISCQLVAWLPPSEIKESGLTNRVRGSSKISVSGSNYIPRSCYLAKLNYCISLTLSPTSLLLL